MGESMETGERKIPTVGSLKSAIQYRQWRHDWKLEYVCNGILKNSHKLHVNANVYEDPAYSHPYTIYRQENLLVSLHYIIIHQVSLHDVCVCVCARACARVHVYVYSNMTAEGRNRKNKTIIAR
jgi:hypothetical protein